MKKLLAIGEALVDIFNKKTNSNAAPIAIGGGTYAKKFENFVAFGPMFPNPTVPEGLELGNVHETNEGMAIEDLLKASAIYTDALLNLGGVCDENA